MDTQRKTFMLLPRFDYPIDDNIQLGTLLSLSKETNLPDPDEPLNDETNRIAPDATEIKRQNFRQWSVDLQETNTVMPNVEAEIPFFSPVGGGFGHSRSKTDRLAISCDLVTERFTPTAQYLAECLKDPWTYEYCHKFMRPSVYLVSGRMLASNANVQSVHAKSNGVMARASLDTSSVGVPVRVGVGAERLKASNEHTEAYAQHAFILAYELTRVKLRRRTGAVRGHAVYTKCALFDDSKDAMEDVMADGLSAFWEIEVVDQDTEHVV